MAVHYHLPLYRAAVRGDWTEARGFFDEGTYKTTAIISGNHETALHVSISVGKANDFVTELVNLMPIDALAIQNSSGETALHFAAKVGNIEAVRMLVDKRPSLLYYANNDRNLPVHSAVINCHKDVTEYLLLNSQPNVQNSPFEGILGVRLLTSLISSEFFDVAMWMLRNHPNLVKATRETIPALGCLASMNSVFGSRESFSWWQNLIYSCIPLEGSSSRYDGDFENHGLDTLEYSQTSRFLIALVAPFKMTAHKELMRQRALELARRLCEEIDRLSDEDARYIIERSIAAAAESGNHEIAALIIERFPSSVFYTDATGGNIFHIAARNRQENIFNLLYQMSDVKRRFYDSVDSEGNSYMHLCGKLAPPHKLNLVPGAALQMQRELQWFKEVEKFVNPSRRSWPNNDGKTPDMLFAEEHQELKAEGEKWMKDTATSCTLAATLIATVVFAAAFTVPGGIQPETGRPIFWGRFSFTLFAISDAVSFFTSVTSLLMFLSILTSRYSEEDFLYVLPKRLCIGLLTLFISITFMVVAFGVALYLVMEEKRYILAPISALACLPVASFVLLQFPLLRDVFYYAYFPIISGPKSKRILY